jgi:hypothetical protein
MFFCFLFLFFNNSCNNNNNNNNNNNRNTRGKIIVENDTKWKNNCLFKNMQTKQREAIKKCKLSDSYKLKKKVMRSLTHTFQNNQG